MESINLTARAWDSAQYTVEIDLHPNECPYCHKTITPIEIGHFIIGKGNITGLHRCSNQNCHEIFLSYYSQSNLDGNFYFNGSSLGNLVSKEFSESINKISSSFVEIYNQAYSAEQYNLIQICGIGYRKSLEFLIKDYLINLTPDIAEAIKKKTLGNCIKQNLEAPKVKIGCRKSCLVRE